MPSYINISQTVTEIRRFNGFQNVGCPTSWIFEIQFFHGLHGRVKNILHQHAKFREIGQTAAEISRFW